MEEVPRRGDLRPPRRDPITREFGPVPPDLSTLPPPAGHESRRPLVVGAIALTVVLTLGWAVAMRPVGWPPKPCLADAGRVDVDGDGCADVVFVRNGVVSIPAGVLAARAVTFEVGAPGDVVVLGDWDCDGSDTPGVYRPATGAIALFTRWPAAGSPAPPAVRAAGRVNGTATVVRHGRCDELVVS
jgi:hypothetical protein